MGVYEAETVVKAFSNVGIECKLLDINRFKEISENIIVDNFTIIIINDWNCITLKKFHKTGIPWFFSYDNDKQPVATTQITSSINTTD